MFHFKSRAGFLFECYLNYPVHVFYLDQSDTVSSVTESDTMREEEL